MILPMACTKICSIHSVHSIPISSGYYSIPMAMIAHAHVHADVTWSPPEIETPPQPLPITMTSLTVLLYPDTSTELPPLCFTVMLTICTYDTIGACTHIS